MAWKKEQKGGKIRGRGWKGRGDVRKEKNEKKREREAVWAWAEVFNGAVSMNCETCSRGIIGLGSSTMFDAEDRSQ